MAQVDEDSGLLSMNNGRRQNLTRCGITPPTRETLDPLGYYLRRRRRMPFDHRGEEAVESESRPENSADIRVGYSYLFFFSTAVVLLSLIGLFVFALIRRSNSATAKALAVLGIGILLLVQIIQLVLNYVIARVAGPNQMVMYHAAFSLISSVFYVGGIGSLVFAAFYGRGINAKTEFRQSVPVTPVPPNEENPYSPTH